MNHLLSRYPQLFAIFLILAAVFFLLSAIRRFDWRDLDPFRVGCACFALGILFVFSGCANGTAPTAEQINAYSNAAHTVIHNGVRDYKEVIDATKK